MSGQKQLENFVREVYTYQQPSRQETVEKAIEKRRRYCDREKEDSVQEIPIAQSEKNKQHQRINEHQEGAKEEVSEAWPELKTPVIVDNLKSVKIMPDWSVGQVSIADSVDRNLPVPEEEQRGWFQKHIEPINEIVREANQNFSMSEQSIISDQGSHDHTVD